MHVFCFQLSGCVLENGSELPNGQSVSENCTRCECQSGTLVCGPDAAQDVDGQWSTWTQWSDCSKDCRKYNKVRYRICGSPEAACNGATCAGDAQETEPCQRIPCPCVLRNGTELPNGQSLSENCIKCECKNGTLGCGPDAAQDVDGQWSTWTQWSNCSKDCRKYNKIRYRICGSPEAECNGATCVGDAQETEPCQRSPCPCVLRNGTELPNGQSLSENCTKCECKNGTLDCGPDAAQDVDGQWSTWTQWSNCSKDYINYNRTRYRICGSPEAECNGNTCTGNAQETEPCQSP
ncbi:hypothetical protein SNE40_022384 [Patella caerulea]|uniref:Uncharacterized protein n=1 Tax=Patella caerulea TaxID=87958 RepID=A0AAN8G3W5_PATCE